jgi:hypothetical protein
MSIQIDQLLDWRGRGVVDRDGQKIGTFEEIYLDEGTDEPAWAAVKTGTFGLRRSRVVPIAAAESDGNNIRVPFTKQQVKTAPTIDSDGWVPERDQATILRHYGMIAAESPTGTKRRTDKSEPAADEEQPSGMRLKRYTVTETLTRRSEFGPD